MAEPSGAAGLVREILRSGSSITDEVFDRLYPSALRAKSEIHWTPVSVALHAARLLAPEPGIRVLDLGAGCGKLCCIGGVTTTAHWHGVDRDPELVGAAYHAAIALGIDHRTSFAVGDFTQIAWRGFDSLYLFNPFEAALFESPLHDGPIAHSLRWADFCRDVEATETRLAEMPRGTRVVTYHGFGGEMPGDYTLVHRVAVASDFLSLWIKRPHARRAPHGARS